MIASTLIHAEKFDFWALLASKKAFRLRTGLHLATGLCRLFVAYGSPIRIMTSAMRTSIIIVVGIKVLGIGYMRKGKRDGTR